MTKLAPLVLICIVALAMVSSVGFALAYGATLKPNGDRIDDPKPNSSPINKPKPCGDPINDPIPNTK